MTKKEYFVYDCDAIDDLISSYFGIDFEIVAEEELNNYSAKSFTIEPKDLNQYDSNRLRLGNYGGMTLAFLNKMCFDGKIASGNYLVEVFW